ncbi:hypothetical protein AVEN_140257-1 [Araneus ventricosus]|uniref:Uncharacterized protein n=1 Tax=Araneus ventricosus TaxID=182803 RepID=A0A4Y2JSY9_ARAVE|nr:hypothetical protein AVEN_6881-1 [Araneus ventricosus]GBM92487.1 hypothetical protein AVEN_190063-1 [Araneus ventricosus]GBM92628.1 hypothetical protein AVEN_56417-1 [Araneus ventricosus]GBM92735.1 hypothetical protein AVEN_140257-1 [Araneus ventricosus]
MLHAAFQNIKGLPHFGVRWWVFYNTFVPDGIINFYCLVLLTASQISKSVSVAATGMFSSVDIHSSYSSFCIPSEGSMTITEGHALARYMDDFQRVIMKYKSRNSGDVWGRVALDVSL